MFKRRDGFRRPMMSFRTIRWAAAVGLPLAAAASAAAPDARAAPVQAQYGQMIVRERIMIRVPVRNRDALPVEPSQTRWKEKHGPKCIAAKSIAGAALLSQNSVDLVLRDSRRIRARLERSCPALDYYYGFYITPNADGQICADRDAIRSRMGGECQIDRFRLLKPAKD
jgi:hypothetical protein